MSQETLFPGDGKRNWHLIPWFDGQTFDPSLDLDRLTSLQARAFKVMFDGQWHRLKELARACGGSEAGLSARIRDMRKKRWGAWTVEDRRVLGARGLWEYRLDVEAGPEIDQ